MGHRLRDSDAMTITIGCPDKIDGREGRQATTWPAWSGQRSLFAVADPEKCQWGCHARPAWPEGAYGSAESSAPAHSSTTWDERLRAQRVVEHMRRRGYPTPAVVSGVGATATHVWGSDGLR